MAFYLSSKLKKMIDERNEYEKRRKERILEKEERLRIKQGIDLSPEEVESRIAAIKKYEEKICEGISLRIRKRKANIARFRREAKKRREETRRKIIAQREYYQSIGEEIGKFAVCLMKNGVYVSTLCDGWSKLDTAQKYYDIAEKNNTVVELPQMDNAYEIMLVQKLKDDTENKAYLRDKSGKFVECYFRDARKYKILDKCDWLMEDRFVVYGYNERDDRKDFSFIFNSLLLGHSEDFVRVIVYKNKLIIHYDTDLDIIVCKSIDHAISLYNALEEKFKGEKKDLIFFIGILEGKSAGWLIDDIQSKTKWPRNKCMSSRAIYPSK